jgi:hypothetical protein
MQFAIMEYVGKTVRDKSIYGALDKASPGDLPIIDSHGRWMEIVAVDEDRVGFAEEAKRSIAKFGYYLFSCGWGGRREVSE